MINTKLILGLGMALLGSIATKNSIETAAYIRIDKNNNFATTQNPGKEIYADFCIQCHGATGKGDGTNFPPLDGSSWLKNKRKASIAAVKYGKNGMMIVNGKWYNGNMPAMGLTDQEVADVMNYIMTSWSNKQTKVVTVTEVAAIKK
jgi:mono/diheme cytochrome c family protein